MNTDQEKNVQNKSQAANPDSREDKPVDTGNSKSILTDNKDNVEYRDDDERPILNSTQQGFGLDDGPNQPLSKEMLNDLQDAGQQDLHRQREEEKQAKHKND